VRALLHEALGLLTLVLVAGPLVVGLPVVVMLTRVLDAGPADLPSGPAQLVQLGGRSFDLGDVDVYERLRPPGALDRGWGCPGSG
jgi:hypothetical protein